MCASIRRRPAPAPGPASRPTPAPGRAILRLAGGLLFGFTATLAFAGGDSPALKPGDSPVVPQEDAAPTFVPPFQVTGKGLRSPQEWKQIIDATWGPGPEPWIALSGFDTFWRVIDERFACFQGLDVDWQALRDHYRPEVASGVSLGRLVAIMNHLALALQESHTQIHDRDVNVLTAPRPGVPVMYGGPFVDNSHFGACLTPMPDRSLLVYKVADHHPLNLVPGDIVLGYEGVSWKDLYPMLLEAELPFTGTLGSSPSSREHGLLICAGMNWHLFDTIDVLRYSSGQVEHLSTSLLDGLPRSVSCTEQMDLPGVPKPPISGSVRATWGMLQGTRIGYIYVYAWAGNVEQQFYDAIRALTVDQDTDGLIIDFRYNGGGNMFLSSKGLNLLFRDRTPTIAFDKRGSPSDHLDMVSDPAGPPEDYVINDLPDEYACYRPIAVLTGPAAVSSGDQVALRMTFHPRARTFGKSTMAAFNAPAPMSGLGRRWTAAFAAADAFRLSEPGHYLTHREFPVDYPVWLSRADVVQGKDTVVDLAVRWIRNRPPVAVLTVPPANECTGPDGAVVRLDASSSSDPDSTPGTRDDIGSFDWFEDVGGPGERALGTGEVLKVSLPLGSHRISLRVRDTFGEQDVAEATVAVVDTTPPSLDVSLNPSILWPPNHRMVPIHAAVTASDRCGGTRLILASVTNDEPDEGRNAGDGNFPGDVQGAELGRPDFDLQLRAERGRGATGRTYTLLYTARDDSGNSVSASSAVQVPRQ